MSVKKILRKIRIVQRADGAVFTWTPALDAILEMQPGWLAVLDDGTEEITLDKITSRQLDPSTISQREKILIDENARLREQVAASQGLSSLEDGEVPLPLPGGEVNDLSGPNASDVEEVVEFQPEAPVFSTTALQAMKKEDLVAHARNWCRSVPLPDDVTKATLIEICTKLQSGESAIAGE